MLEDLVESIRQRNTILFAGSGLSAQLELPTWNKLIEQVAKELQYDPSIFATYGDSLQLAEYYTAKKGSIGGLRSWMDNDWHAKPLNHIQHSKAHEYLVKLDFPLIYTTNYDRWIERAYEYYGKDAIKIVDVFGMTQIKDGVTQIIKFHGDFDSDHSLVLTESSYFERLDLEGPLDLKLRSDMLGKSILFIGYSLSDINIRYLLYKLQKIWENSSLSNKKPKIYLFLLNPNPVLEAVYKQRGIEVIVSQSEERQHALSDFLKELLERQ